MASQTKKTNTTKTADAMLAHSETQSALQALANRVAEAKATQPGLIVLRLRGSGGGTFCLNCFTPSDHNVLGTQQNTTDKASGLRVSAIKMQDEAGSSTQAHVGSSYERRSRSSRTI